MKLSLRLLLFTQIIITLAHAQVQRPFTARYYNPSVRGNIVYVSNNIITTTAVINTEVAPAGTAINNSGSAEYIDVEPLVTLIPWNSTWKFCDSGYAPGAAGTAWRNAAYNDMGWQ